MRTLEPQFSHPAELLDRIAGSTLLAAAFGFFVFLPYPAPVMGIQVGHVMAVGILGLALFQRTPLFSWPLLAIILVPSLLSATWVTLGGEGNSDIAWKVFAAFTLSVLTVGAAEAILVRNALPFFVGAAFAVLLHAVVGGYQMLSFQSDHFPFAELYVNSSFRSVQDDAERIARWSKRPFGIFPEPSAMAASITPFILLWSAGALQLVRTRYAQPRNCRALFLTAAIGGLLLMLASRSGHSIIALLGLMGLLAVWAVGARMTPRNLRWLMLVALGFPFLLWYGAAQLEQRTSREGRFDTESWRDRRNSLADGLTLLEEQGPGAMFTGIGVGQGPRLIGRKTGADAIWSVSINYLVETGLIGCISAMLAVGLVWQHVRRSSSLRVLTIIAIVWAVGVTVTTSYSSLLPLWASLALVCAWPKLIANDVVSPTAPRRAGVVGGARRPRKLPV